MRASQRRLRHVHGMTDACGYDFSINVVNGKNIRNRFHQMNPVFADVIQPAHERTDKNSPRARRHQRLIRRKNECHIRRNIVL